VEFPGTVMLSRMMDEQLATAAGMAEYAVTWHGSAAAGFAVELASVCEPIARPAIVRPSSRTMSVYDTHQIKRSYHGRWVTKYHFSAY
jgi:hypothetical protein